jgi:hypothetical protein
MEKNRVVAAAACPIKQQTPIAGAKNPGRHKKQPERSEKRLGCSQKSSIAAQKKKGVGPKKKGDAPEMNVVPTQQEPSADQKPDASGPNQPS